MQRIVSGSIWIHVKTQIPYKILGIARDVANPQSLKVIYESTQRQSITRNKRIVAKRDIMDQRS